MATFAGDHDLTSHQRQWVGRYVRVTLPTLIVLAVIQLALLIAQPEPPQLYGLAYIIAYAGLVSAARQISERRSPAVATTLICGGLLLVTMAGIFTNPLGIAILAQLPLMAIILALPFQRRAVFRYTLIAALAVLTVTILRTLLMPLPPTTPTLQIGVIFSACTCASTLIVMLVSYQRWFSNLVYTIQTLTAQESARQAIYHLAEQRRQMIDVIRELLAGRSLIEIHSRIGHLLNQILSFETVALLWHNPETHKFSSMGPSNQFIGLLADHDFAVPQGAGLADEVIQSGQPILVNNAHLDPRSFYHGIPPAAEHLMILPVYSEHRILALLGISRSSGAPFSDEEFGAAQLFTSFLSLAVTNSYLLEQTQGSEQKYRRLFEESSDVIYLSTPDGAILDINAAGVKLLGYTRQEMLGQISAVDLYPDPAEREIFKRQIGERGMVEGLRSRRRRRDGRIIYVEESATAIRDASGQIIAYQGYLRDISEQVRSSEQLQQQVRELQRHTHDITVLNQMGAQLQACRTEQEACERTADALHQIFPAVTGAIYLAAADQIDLQRKQAWGAPYEFPLTLSEIDLLASWPHSPAQVAPISRLATILIGEHAAICLRIFHDGEMIGLIALQRAGDGESTEDLALLETAVRPLELAIANIRLRETLHRQAIRDPLTGLFNRRYMEESLERELHRMARRSVPLGVIMIDIDHFKQFNDDYGHAAGDSILRELGQFLLANIRAEDIACRYGGEEFILILPESTLDDITRRAEQICYQARDLVVQHHRASPLRFTISLGVAAFPDHGTTVEELLYSADMALYRAKSLGRNQVVTAALTPAPQLP
jgi:diguanylate cyclase (GGDEF)-like protein/PAS domain S-box-containing protein